jgi:exosortase
MLAAVLALAFAPALLALARVWASVDYYSHGFLVPLVAFWIARARWRRGFPRARDRSALGALALVVALYAIGVLGGLVALQGVALVGAVAAFVWRVWGRAALRALALPIAFLLFMVPIPAAWLTPSIVQLQLLVSAAAVSMLHLFDFTVAREGNVLLLGSGDALFVEEACSGITSIVTLLPLSVVLAAITLRGAWRRLALVAAVIPVAMLGNLLRVVATLAAANAWGAARATSGPLHEMAGLLTFALACLLLIVFSALLGRGQGRAAGDAPVGEAT